MQGSSMQKKLLRKLNSAPLHGLIPPRTGGLAYWPQVPVDWVHEIIPQTPCSGDLFLEAGKLPSWKSCTNSKRAGNGSKVLNLFMALAVFCWFFEVLKRDCCGVCYTKVWKFLVKQIFPSQYKTLFQSAFCGDSCVSLAEILGQFARGFFFSFLGLTCPKY